MSICSLLLCCWKRVFAMTSAFSWQNSMRLCPASFCIPRPNLPVTSGVSWLPTFAFQSPVRKMTSFLCVSSKRSCRLDSLEKTLMLGGIGGRRRRGDRGWDGWMTSPTRWTWVWVNSRSRWWTGRPGMLRFMGSQRVGHDWVTELSLSHSQLLVLFLLTV